MLSSNEVAIAFGSGAGTYPSCAPFRPDRICPELARNVPCGAEANHVHRLLRTLLHTMGCDAGNFGSANWNPLGEWIQPGQQVVIKPNLVRHLHLAGGDYQAVVTHGSVVRAVADYVALALRGDGQIVIGDAPVQATDFATVVAKTGLREVCRDLGDSWKVPVRLADFRLWALRGEHSQETGVGDSLSGDVAGYCAVALDSDSMLTALNEHVDRFRVTCYDPHQMKSHHNQHRHEYLVAKAVLDADVVINLPKLKTHRKVGMTAAMKNLVGINGHKDWLPHHRCGSVAEGGDEYRLPSRLKRLTTSLQEGIYRNPGSAANAVRRLSCRVLRRLSHHFARDEFAEGSWYGNDTCWRMCLDLNRILFYADAAGQMSDAVQRCGLTIVDAIIAGDGEGPMTPDARPCNWLTMGQNPAAVDAVLATLIGFDYRKLPLISTAFSQFRWPLTDFEPNEINVHTNDSRFSALKVGQPCDAFGFRPASSWVGHVEMEPRQVVDAGAGAAAS